MFNILRFKLVFFEETIKNKKKNWNELLGISINVFNQVSMGEIFASIKIGIFLLSEDNSRKIIHTTFSR